MYLLKIASGTYYTRICLPKSLRDVGYPFDIKFSLLTKSRSIAIERNCYATIKLKQLITSFDVSFDNEQFKKAVAHAITELRSGWACSPDSTSPISMATPTQTKPILPLSKALKAFIDSKSKEPIRPLTIKQLTQRIQHFIDFISDGELADIGSDDAMRYRDHLLNEGRSSKTNKEYIAALRQFMSYCVVMKWIRISPFDGISLPRQAPKPLDEQRIRWSLDDINKLLRHTYSQQNIEFKWTTLLLLYSGMRPSEACQLRLADIDTAKQVIRVTNAGETQYIKNQSSIRDIPIHKHLIERGFLGYVAARRDSGSKQLFSYTPSGINVEWSKQYCKALALVQESLKMKPNQRPTAYSFRHTFIDQLKQLGHSESLISQLVGHAGQSQTMNRYGKKYPIKTLEPVINSLAYS